MSFKTVLTIIVLTIAMIGCSDFVNPLSSENSSGISENGSGISENGSGISENGSGGSENGSGISENG